MTHHSSFANGVKFTEAQLESAIIDLLKVEGYPYVSGESISRAPQEVLIKKDLRAYISSRYEADGITEGEIQSILNQLEAYPASDLYESNKSIMRLITDGFILRREHNTHPHPSPLPGGEGTGGAGSSPPGRGGGEGRDLQDLYIQLVDYSALAPFREPKEGEVPTVIAEKPEASDAYGSSRNIFKMVNQLEIVGYEKRIPDGILYINGLPLVVFEFKSAIREEATIYDAFIQLTTRYRRDIPELFKYNTYCVISDGVNSRAGSFFADYGFWYPWRIASHNPHPQPLSQREKGGFGSSPPGRSRDEGPQVNYRGGFEYVSLVKKAKELREKQTPAESVFWELAKNRQIDGIKFRRQHQIGNYIVDFYSHEFKIVVEFDGAIHDTDRLQKHDKKRDAYLKSLGFTVLRFSNEEIFENTEAVLQQIISVSSALPSPSGRGVGGEGSSRPQQVNQVPADGIDSLYTMIGGLFCQTTLCDVIRNFIFFPDTSRRDEKILCRYPQYYAATKLYQNILEHRRPFGDGKGGTYFGATGCGKSFTMLFLTRLLMRSMALSSPTIVLITDRTDLDDQLSGLFTNGKGYIGDASVISVESRDHLRMLLKGRNSGGVFLTTIHKFTEDTELLTDRDNVICISDEAHRSQVNLDQKLKITAEGVTKSFGFAKYLHDSLPNATYVGFTGTPIDATLDVFGPVVDSYTMTESVVDEITVRIVYEGRAAKVLLDNSKLSEIEEYYAECAEQGASDYAIEESKKANIQMNAILGDPDRLKALAADFVAHYEARVEEGATVAGKAMFVSSSRSIAYDFYQEVIALLGERSSRCVSSTDYDFAQHFTKSFGLPEEWHTRKLPHREKEGLVQSITFRLADSLPQEILSKMEEELAGLSEDDLDLEKRKRYQKHLDNGYGCCALANEKMADVMMNALKHHDGERYELLAWSIMPNHVHVVILAKASISKIVQSWKSYTGKWALKQNSHLNLGIPSESQKFWQEEYWDRFVRNEEHFNNVVRYVLQNPEKAGLGEGSVAAMYTGHALGGRTERELHPSQIKMVMTRGKDDPKELYDMLGTKDDRKELDRQFKSIKSNFKIAIVVDMWLTGFDVPFLDTMYIDKPVKRHNLIQTISRVNRKFEQKEKGLVVDYIGIKKQMNLALAQYSKSDGVNIEEIEQSVIVVKDHLDLMRAIFHKFDSSPYFSGEALQQLHCLNQAAEYVQVTADLEKRFMFLAKRMKAAYDICVGSDAFTQSERDHIHFYLAIRSIVYKLTKGDAPDLAQMNAKVQKMIAEALKSDGVEEIFKMGQGDTSEVDIFDPDYLAKIEKIKLPNTRVKLLQQLLAKAIEDFKKVNKIKGVYFSKQFKALVEKYNDRSEADVLRSEVLEDFTDEIINLYHAIKKEKNSFEELGIDFEEKAFYDILKALTVKYDFAYPEDKLLELAKKVKTVVDDKAKYTDWSQRADIKAELKVDLIILLAENDYPPVDRDEVYKEIFEQAENFKKYQSK